MALSTEELDRYARHIVLAEVGGPGQARLKAARVLVVGAGGLGSPVLLYLAAAGVGTLGIVDDDVVSLSNLQRQIIHQTAAVGEAKTVSAARALAALNPHVRVDQHRTRLTAENALALVSAYDLVVDATDNFPARFIVSDACFLARKPLVSAAVGQFDGQISTFKPYLTTATGTPYPSYRCFIGELPERAAFPTCEEMGILGALPGIMGSMQAMEAIKEVLGIGEGLAGRVLMYDALLCRSFMAALAWNPHNPLNGLVPTITAMDPRNYA